VRRAVVARWFGRETAAWDLSAVVARFARRRFGWAPAGLSGTRLLDVGSGDGTFLLDVRAAGWNAVGLDVSSRAAANAARLGLDVRVGELTQRPFEPDTFDVVRLWSVLEHVREPLETMREVARVLRPGGWAIVQVPNARGAAARALGQRWVGWEVPAHLWHFTPATLRRLLHDAGLVPTELHHTSVGTLAHALRTERVAAGRLVVALVDLLFDLVGAGDSIMAFARRPSAPAGGSPT
jgi:SAM-dependent methyltransferase